MLTAWEFMGMEGGVVSLKSHMIEYADGEG
jgi:hypothetical protein